MKITQVDICPVTIAYKNPYQVAMGTTETGQHVIIRVHTDEGIVGYGETSHILPDVTGETQDTIVIILQKYLAPLIIGEDPFNLNGIMAKFDGLTLGRYGFPYSRAAIDCALYDIQGKALGVPLYQLLGGATRKEFQVARSLPVRSPQEMGETAAALKEQGYRLITVKVGFEVREDIKRVEAVRKAVGDDFPIEVDVNQGWGSEEAVPALRRMEEYGITAAEQPCPWWDLEGMAEVARAVDVPVIADESVHTISDAHRVIRMRAGDIVCIKLVKLGGIFYAKKIAAAAECAGISCSMGSRHTFGVGTAAIHHFVASTPNVQEPIGYATALERYKDDIIAVPIKFENGIVHVPEGPGLGIEVDEEKMKAYEAGGTLTVKKK